MPKSSASHYQQAASLVLYQSVLQSEAGQAFLTLLCALAAQAPCPIRCFQAYGNWFKLLAQRNESWQDYVITRILLDDNPFSQQVQRRSLLDLPPSLVAAARHDLQVLQSLRDSPPQLRQELQDLFSITPVAWTVENCSTALAHSNWTDALEELADAYRQNGTGLVAQYRALRWQQEFIGIAHPDPVQLDNIVGYESQKEALLKNTESLLAGYPALHVLLYGSRGSGKSSLVKGLLQKYGDRGLRLVEVSKAQLTDLPIMIEQLRDLPQKIIIFVDDLSFEEDNDSFKALKVVLEGSLTALAPNVVVYATSNRRHLVREFFGDRPRPLEGEEVHAWDTVQEKLSFSDRFGLTLTFEPANQDTYLEIVRHLAYHAQIPISPEELANRAKQWATRHNGRSGRTARQFIDFLQADLAF